MNRLFILALLLCAGLLYEASGSPSQIAGADYYKSAIIDGDSVDACSVAVEN